MVKPMPVEMFPEVGPDPVIAAYGGRLWLTNGFCVIWCDVTKGNISDIDPREVFAAKPGEPAAIGPTHERTGKDIDGEPIQWPAVVVNGGVYNARLVEPIRAMWPNVEWRAMPGAVVSRASGVGVFGYRKGPPALHAYEDGTLVAIVAATMDQP